MENLCEYDAGAFLVGCLRDNGEAALRSLLIGYTPRRCRELLEKSPRRNRLRFGFPSARPTLYECSRRALSFSTRCHTSHALPREFRPAVWILVVLFDFSESEGVTSGL